MLQAPAPQKTNKTKNKVNEQKNTINQRCVKVKPKISEVIGKYELPENNHIYALIIPVAQKPICYSDSHQW